ncbi:hypothetical protein SUGI_0252870 [Cryptomeria japonica]|nr:hypothetical protein SUGI_0252870 [Cryptomeria japonica]
MDGYFETETEDVNMTDADGIASESEVPEVVKACHDKPILKEDENEEKEGKEDDKPILKEDENEEKEGKEEKEHHLAKRLKSSGEGGASLSLSSVDVGIKQAAEVVLILSNMAQMRAGRPPTEIERELMVKARHQIGFLVGNLLLPKDLVSREVVGNMIDDLGLNKLKQDHPVTPGPRKSIAERASDTMKKIEKAKLSTVNTSMVPPSLSKAEREPANILINGISVALPAQVMQAGSGKNSVSISQPLPILQPFMPAISAIAQTPISQHVQIETRASNLSTASVAPHPIGALTSAIISQAQVSLTAPVAALAPILRAEDRTETRPTVVGQPGTTVMSSVLEAHSVPAKMRGQVLKPLAVLGTISDKKSVPLSSETTTTVVRDHSKGSMLSPSKVPGIVQTSISLENSGKDVDLPAQPSSNVKETQNLNEFHITSPQFEQKDFKGVSTATAFLNHQTTQVPPQGLKLSDSVAIRANHADIAQNVQKILQARPPDLRQWEPPSKAYMNASVTCQVCKINVLDIDTILVCDSCEKGVHLKCLQAYNQRGIPKGDWHCPKCLVASGGRPLPPKYGRVGKSSFVRRTPASANKSSPLASVGKKMETAHSKSPHHTAVSIGLNAPEIPIHVDLTNTNNRHMHATGDNSGELKPKSEMLLVQNIKQEGGLNEPIKQESSKETADSFTGLSGPLSGKENQCSPKNEVFGSHVLPEDSRYNQHSKMNLHVAKQPQTLSNSQGADRLKMEQAVSAVRNVMQSTAIQQLPAEAEGLPFSPFAIEGQTSKDIGDISKKVEDAQQSGLHKSTIFETKSLVEATDPSRATEEDDAYCVEWVGDKLYVVGGKTYYQSCSVNGVSYRLHDYALFRPEIPNVPPYIAKLQVLWEDDDTGSKWARVNWFYYPNDIPQTVSRPTTPEKDEIHDAQREARSIR